MLKIFKIKGTSMSPSLEEGDFVLTLSKRLVSLKIDDFIVFTDSIYGTIVKQIVRKEKNSYWVKGLSSGSMDSESLGSIPRERIYGKVILKIPRKKKLYSKDSPESA